MNIFEEARIKLTAWYLLVIIIVSMTFSVYIYQGVSNEFVRSFDVIQKRFEINFPISNAPTRTVYIVEDVDTARERILCILVYANVAIFIFAGVAGYFLAGMTLRPIKKNMDEQKKFVSNASHELRTPLTSIKTETEVALRDKKIT